MEKRLIDAKEFCLISFTTTHSALKAEKVLEERGISFLTVPTPREISEGCGLSVRIFCPDLESVTGLLAENGVIIKGFYKIDRASAEIDRSAE